MGQEKEIAEDFVRLSTGAWMYPAYGVQDKELKNFVNRLIETGHIDSEDVSEALDDHPIQIFLAYCLYYKKISLDNFKELVSGTDYATGVLNYKESYKKLIDIGIKINEKVEK